MKAPVSDALSSACLLQAKIRDGMTQTFTPGDEPLLQLPEAGISAAELRKKLAFKVCRRRPIHRLAE